jgi:hypothetical protein
MVSISIKWIYYHPFDKCPAFAQIRHRLHYVQEYLNEFLPYGIHYHFSDKCPTFAHIHRKPSLRCLNIIGTLDCKPDHNDLIRPTYRV